MKGFSLNQATTKHWPLEQVVAGCADAGVRAVGLWREEIQAYGVQKSAALLRESGVEASSLCRSGFFHQPGWYDENRRALDEAATVGAPTLVVLSGGLPDGSRDLDTARRNVGEAIGRLVPHAQQVGVRLAIEALHPMFCSDRCVVASLGQALELAAPYPPGAVGVVVDTYHLWWDDQVWAQIARAGREGRIASFQISDWVTPLPAGVLLGRGLPGTGCIDLPRFARSVRDAGYDDYVEVEVFNEQVWARPGAEVLAEALAGYRDCVEEALA